MPREVPRLASLATRSAALYSALVGAAVLLAGWLISAGHRKEALAGRERDLEHRARTVHVRFETEVGAVARDALFLANAPFLRRLADAGNHGTPPPELLAEVQGTFEALLEGKPSYGQTRLLSLRGEGNEIIRLDYVGGRVMAQPPDALQAKGHRDYFLESAALNPNEVYLSRINLNQEFGEISTPHVPTLRVVSKVFDNAGQPFGLVVINVDLRPLFSELQTMAGAEASLYIANREGDYLVHPDPSKSFGFDLGERHRLEDDFGPDVINAPKNAREIARFVRFPLIEHTGHQLIVGASVPREQVLSELTAIRNRSLAAALAAALVAAALVWALAFLLSRRLAKLSDAIARYQPGTGTPNLPERGNDEIAVVARKFSALARKTDEQIRDLEQARRLADENRRAKEEFLATLSHEIRTPMNAVTGLIHALATDRPADHQLATLSSLQFASRKLIAVVSDVLDFSKIEAGHISFERAPFDLHVLLDNIRISHQPQARDGGIALMVRHAPGVPRMVCGDALRLYQILNNLVQNALKFTARGGEVLVDVTPHAAPQPERIRLSFRVQDTGMGMTPEELEKALSRFGQARPGTNRQFGGTGLGLPIARMLVELQDGTFHADSTPGKGSCFAFSLEFERASLPAPAPAPSPSRAPALAGVRILCVEDVASNRQVVSALLAPSNANLEFATNAAETITALAQSPAGALPDLILLDLQLPDRDGASLAADLHSRWPSIPVVGLTAQTSGPLLDRCREAGINTFLWKPIEPDRFFATIAETVGAERAGNAPPEEPGPEPVLELFDRDPTRTSCYLLTLAEELDAAARRVDPLCEQSDHKGLRALHHRLQNGLTLIAASDVLDQLDSLSAVVRDHPIRAQGPAKACRDVLEQTAARLRAWSHDLTSVQAP